MVGAGSYVPPLQILVWFHADFQVCRALADDLYQRFMVLGGGPGLRIPVQFGVVRDDRMPPALPALTAGAHTLIVVLVDERMARRAEAADRAVADAWGGVVHDLVETLAGGTSHGILPVAVDARALGWQAARMRLP